MQGFNMGRYVPPDVEGTTTGNRLHGKRPPAVPTVRFEMPFAVWCASCPKPTLIGQGVRFNAEKRRVGAYHSTPVWRFRMRHADCGGSIEIDTDPKNTTYVVARGGSRRAAADEPPPLLDDAARDAARRDAFASLEKTIADRDRLRRADERIAGLAAASARHWADPYAQNQRLRRAFRAGRRERERDAAAAQDLRDRLGLGIDLLPATADDARRAAAVDFGRADGGGGGGARLAAEVAASARARDPWDVKQRRVDKQAGLDSAKPDDCGPGKQGHGSALQEDEVKHDKTGLVDYDSD